MVRLKYYQNCNECWDEVNLYSNMVRLKFIDGVTSGTVGEFIFQYGKTQIHKVIGPTITIQNLYSNMVRLKWG